jgi:membrane protease YdiL (CAAX protease family)
LEPVAPLRGENPPWTFLEVVLLTAFGIFVVAFLQGIAVGIAHRRYPLIPLADLARNARIVLPAQLLAYLALLGGMMAMLRSRGLHFWRSVRWNWPGTRWAGFLLLGIMMAFVIQGVSALLPIPKKLPIEQFFADPTSAYMLALFGITLAPLMEELYFRGFLYPVLERRLGVPLSVFLTSLAFAAIHASQLGQAWAPLLLLLLVGLLLTIARVRTGSVGTSFLLHVGYNLTLFTVMYFVTDHFRNMQNLK